MTCLKLIMYVPLALGLLTPASFPSFFVEGRKGQTSVSRCTLFGDDNIKTFDDQFYSFGGDCSYLLTGDCWKHSFSILGDFENGKRKSLSVYLGEFFDIHLFINGTVTQGDRRISIPYASKGLYLEMEAGYYKLSSEIYGFVAKIDADGNFQLLLPERHFNKTCGLCGNFNDFAEDDFVTQEGTLTSDPYNFANSWALRGAEHGCKRVSLSSDTCNIASVEMEKNLILSSAALSGNGIIYFSLKARSQKHLK